MADRITKREAAAYIHVSPRQLQRLTIPHYRVGHRTVLYDVADLEAFLASCKVDLGEPVKLPRKAPAPPSVDYRAQLRAALRAG
jgi:hypothetical protein